MSVVLQLVVVAGWVIAFGLSMATVYGHYELPPSPSGAHHAYTSTRRDVFALSVGWLVFACCSGYGGTCFVITVSKLL